MKSYEEQIYLDRSQVTSEKNGGLKGLSILDHYFFHKMFFVFFSYRNYPNFSSIMIFFQSFGDNTTGEEFGDPRRFKLILWSIIGATRGGPNRARILNLLITESLNSNQISRKLNLDHKTIRHHLKILTKNFLIAKSSGEAYGANYILTPIMQKNIESLNEIVSKMRK